MNNGQRVLAAALATEGIREEPMGGNSGAEVETWQRQAEQDLGLPAGTYARAPYCAIWARAMYRAAGVEVPSRLLHPFTGYICQEADRLGGLAPKGLAPPASLMVRCAIHVGLVVRDRGNGLLDTIEANVGNAVRRMVRAKADWRIIVPPGIEDEPAQLVTTRPSFGFDDLRLAPDLYGGWASADARDEQMARFAKAHPEGWVAPVRLDRASPYAFRAGPKDTYGATWRFGGWPSVGVRDEQMARYAARAGHLELRAWCKQVVAIDGQERAGASPELTTI